MNPSASRPGSAFPPRPAVASGSPGSQAAGSCSSAVRSGGPGWQNPRRHLLGRPALIWLPTHLPVGGAEDLAPRPLPALGAEGLGLKPLLLACGEGGASRGEGTWRKAGSEARIERGGGDPLLFTLSGVAVKDEGKGGGLVLLAA